MTFFNTDFSRRTSGEGPVWSSGDALVIICMSEVLGCEQESVTRCRLSS